VSRNAALKLDPVEEDPDPTFPLEDAITHARKLLALQDARDAGDIPEGDWKALAEPIT
jgi:hypothetical protein